MNKQHIIQEVAERLSLTKKDVESVFNEALTTEGPWFIVAKIEEGDLYPLMPQEPDVTLLRFRATFLT